MSGSLINVTRYMKQQGLDPSIVYEAQVVDNNDPRKLGRIRARIKGVFDGISDNHLPWAVPRYNHCDGAYNPGGNATDRAGTCMIPKVKHKVGLRFPTADPHRAVWCDYTIDDQVVLPEAKKNYPDRAVWKFSNGTYVILDTRTNEIFVNNPGDIDMTVLGDVNQYIVGNQQLVVTDSKQMIDGYLLNAPETVLKQLSPKPAKQVAFTGLLSKSRAGNRHIHVKGDQTMLVEGNRKVIIKGNDHLIVQKSRLETISQTHRTEGARIEHN